jgi:tRNA threonylcarbamoyladenosine biosynthesis protein TsaB
MNILAMDTSGPCAAVALMQQGMITHEETARHGLTHSQTVLPMAQRALECAGLRAADIDVFACTVGPGSFTGVRIGVTTVKALAHSVGARCLGVDALEALAYGAAGFAGVIAPMFDARRSQVYAAAFRGGAEFERVTDDVAAPLEEFVSSLPEGDVLFLGDGADANREKLKALRPDAHFAPAHLNFPRAAAICALADEHPELAVDYLALKPLYLRAPQAERERLAKGLKV